MGNKAGFGRETELTWTVRANWDKRAKEAGRDLRLERQGRKRRKGGLKVGCEGEKGERLVC